MEEQHYFITSALHWHTGTKLHELIAKQKRKDRNKKAPYNASTYSVYVVPVPEKTHYKIENYAPQVEGATLLFSERY